MFQKDEDSIFWSFIFFSKKGMLFTLIWSIYYYWYIFWDYFVFYFFNKGTNVWLKKHSACNQQQTWPHLQKLSTYKQAWNPRKLKRSYLMITTIMKRHGPNDQQHHTLQQWQRIIVSIMDCSHLYLCKRVNTSSFQVTLQDWVTVDCDVVTEIVDKTDIMTAPILLFSRVRTIKVDRNWVKFCDCYSLKTYGMSCWIFGKGKWGSIHGFHSLRYSR